MKTKRVINKSGAGIQKGKKIFRLTDIDPEFVSMVHAGANRQTSFQVVKADDPAALESWTAEHLEKLLLAIDGVPRNRFGTCSGYGFSGDFEKAWEDWFAKTADPEFPRSPSDYEKSEWDKPESQSDKEGILLTDADAGSIVAAAKKASSTKEASAGDEGLKDETDSDPANSHAGDGEKSSGKTDGQEGDGEGGTENGGADLSSWLEEAGAEVESLSLDQAIQAALNAQPSSDAKTGGAGQSKAQEIDSAGAPPVEEEEAPGDDPKDAKIAQLEAALRKQVQCTKKAKATAARLAKGAVGATSVMQTGEISGEQRRQTDKDDSPSRGAFNRGADIAAAVCARD